MSTAMTHLSEQHTTSTETLIARIYSAFNRRDTGEVLDSMTETVSWPKASEGGRAVGKQEVQDYWTRQWKEFDPHVDPLEIISDSTGRTHVRVHQLVKSLSGDVLSETEVWHIYTIANGLIERMDLGEPDPNSDHAPSAAFSRPQNPTNT